MEPWPFLMKVGNDKDGNYMPYRSIYNFDFHRLLEIIAYFLANHERHTGVHRMTDSLLL